MGLDMYLKGRKYIGWKESNSAQKAVNEAISDRGVININYVEGEVMYWRKANAIHNWFVENVQGGKDDCDTYSVSHQQLSELAKLIDRAIKIKDPSLLPAVSGFFFGDTEYDEYYWQTLEFTSQRLHELMSDRYSEWDFRYCSSW